MFELFYNKLFRLAFIDYKKQGISEEIVSDVFIGIWRRRENVPEINNLKLYLYVSVKNTSLNYLAQLTKTRIVYLEELDFEPLQPFANPEEITGNKRNESAACIRRFKTCPPGAGSSSNL